MVEVFGFDVLKMEVWLERGVALLHLLESHRIDNILYVSLKTQQFVIYLGVLTENCPVLVLGRPLYSVSFALAAKLQKRARNLQQQADSLDNVLARVSSNY